MCVRSKPERRTHELRYLRTHASEYDGRKFSGEVQTPETPVTSAPDFERSVFVFTNGRPRERAISSPPLSRGFVAAQITVKSPRDHAH